MKIWTYFYNAFTMGGSCNVPTGFETILDNEVELGNGFLGYEVLTPKGNKIIVEKESGAIVGNSLEQVKKDITTSKIDVMNKQVKQACEESENVKIISENKFWNTYEK